MVGFLLGMSEGVSEGATEGMRSIHATARKLSNPMNSSFVPLKVQFKGITTLSPSSEKYSDGMLMMIQSTSPHHRLNLQPSTNLDRSSFNDHNQASPPVHGRYHRQFAYQTSQFRAPNDFHPTSQAAICIKGANHTRLVEGTRTTTIVVLGRKYRVSTIVTGLNLPRTKNESTSLLL